MIVFELTETEDYDVYQAIESQNSARQHSFLQSIIPATVSMGRPFLSQHIIKALNFHAITCLHINAGEYRPCPVWLVGDGFEKEMPEFYRVPALMDDLVNQINRYWNEFDALFLATFVLWRLSYIHPFINGNGRTARMASYYVLCVKSGGFIPGSPILPELLKRDRAEYCRHLHYADENYGKLRNEALVPLHGMLERLLQEQLASAGK